MPYLQQWWQERELWQVPQPEVQELVQVKRTALLSSPVRHQNTARSLVSQDFDLMVLLELTLIVISPSKEACKVPHKQLSSEQCLSDDLRPIHRPNDQNT